MQVADSVNLNRSFPALRWEQFVQDCDPVPGRLGRHLLRIQPIPLLKASKPLLATLEQAPKLLRATIRIVLRHDAYSIARTSTLASLKQAAPPTSCT